MELNFFGLPKFDSPNFSKHCAQRKVSLLSELRIICKEIGYEEARRLPSEVRRWWINEMVKEAQEKSGDNQSLNKDGKRIIRKDV